MHNHTDGHKGMLWMMLICCILPVALLLLGGKELFSGGHFFPILVGALVVAHLWMMFGGRKSKNKKP